RGAVVGVGRGDVERDGLAGRGRRGRRRDLAGERLVLAGVGVPAEGPTRRVAAIAARAARGACGRRRAGVRGGPGRRLLRLTRGADEMETQDSWWRGRRGGRRRNSDG